MAFCNSGIWESKVFVFGFAFVANRVSKIIFRSAGICGTNDQKIWGCKDRYSKEGKLRTIEAKRREEV